MGVAGGSGDAHTGEVLSCVRANVVFMLIDTYVCDHPANTDRRRNVLASTRPSRAGTANEQNC